MLPKDPKERKTYPLYSGLLMYFPDALPAVAHLSYVGNQQHNPGQPLHWAREKSTDQEDTILRHLLDHAVDPIDTDGVPHCVKVAWRALAMAQLFLEGRDKKKEDPDDVTPPEPPDYIKFVNGSVIPVPYGEDGKLFAAEQRETVAHINDHIAEGYTATLTSNKDGSTTVDLSHLADPAGRSFLVWGRLQRSTDSKRPAVQPGLTDSSLADAAVWNQAKGYESGKHEIRNYNH